MNGGVYIVEIVILSVRSGGGVAGVHEPLLRAAHVAARAGRAGRHGAGGAQPHQRRGAGPGLGARLPLLERRHAPRLLHPPLLRVRSPATPAHLASTPLLLPS